MKTEELIKLKANIQSLENKLNSLKEVNHQLYKKLSISLKQINDLTNNTDVQVATEDIKTKISEIEEEIKGFENYFKIITAINYLQNLIKNISKENLNKCIDLLIDILTRLEECPEIINETDKLDIIYNLAFTIMKKEALINNGASKLIAYILPKPFHREYLNKIIHTEIEKIFSYSYVNPKLIENLENLIYEIKREGLESNLITTEIMNAIILIENFSESKANIELRTAELNEEIEDIIINLKKQLEVLDDFEFNAIDQKIKKQKRNKKIDTIVFTLSFLLFIGTEVANEKNLQNYNKYETTTTVFSEINDLEKNTTDEEKLSEPYVEKDDKIESCILEVYGEPYLVNNGTITKDYSLYDLSSYLDEYSIEELLQIDVNLIQDKEIKNGSKQLLIQSEENISTKRIITQKEQQKTISNKPLNSILAFLSNASIFLTGAFLSDRIFSIFLHKRLIKERKATEENFENEYNKFLNMLTELKSKFQLLELYIEKLRLINQIEEIKIEYFTKDYEYMKDYLKYFEESADDNLKKLMR